MIRSLDLSYLSVASFGSALLLTLVTTPVARRLAIRLDFLDRPSERKMHREPVPQLGGLAIVVAFSFVVVAGGFILDRPRSFGPLAAILGGAAILAALGLWDDVKIVPGWIKVPVELGLGLLLFVAGSRAELMRSWPLDLILTIGWVIGITNAVNYMDNMDGLSAGVSAIAGACFTFLAAASGQVLVASLAAALTGTALGFLWHNRPPARIFMGDGGSLFLGFLLAGLGLELRFENIQSVSFFVPAAVMTVPIVDALMVSVSRVTRGLSPIHPGRDHISHRLVALGLSTRRAVAVLWFFSAMCGWLGVTIAFAEPRTAYMLIAWMVVFSISAGSFLLRIRPETA